MEPADSAQKGTASNNSDPLLDRIKSEIGKNTRQWITPAVLAGPNPKSKAQRTEPTSSTPNLETEMIPRVNAESLNRSAPVLKSPTPVTAD